MTTLTTARTHLAQWPPFATASVGLAVVLTAVGTFWSPLATYEGRGGSVDDIPEYLVNIAMIAVGAAIIFGLVVRTASAANADRRGLVMAVIGLLSVLVAWTGLPALLAGGSACCALASGRPSTMGKVTLGIVALTLAGAVAFALAG